MKIRTKLFALIASICVGIQIVSFPVMATSEYSMNAAAIELDKQVTELMGERLLLVAEKFANSHDGSSSSIQNSNGVLSNIDSQINNIDEQLAELGVTEVKLNDLNIGSDIQLLVDVPSDGLYKWLSRTYEYTYGGKRYEVQTLFAQPNSKNCALLHSGSQTKSTPAGVKAGVCAMMGTIARAAAAEVPVLSTALTVYDALKSFITTGFSTTTIVDNVDAVYQWNYASQMVFRYVREAGSTQEGKLSFVYSTCSGTQRYDIHSVKFSGTVKTDIAGEQRSATNIMSDKNAADVYNAIRAYISTYEPTSAYLYSIDITGANNVVVGSFDIPAFIGPGQMVY